MIAIQDGRTEDDRNMTENGAPPEALAQIAAEGVKE